MSAAHEHKKFEFFVDAKRYDTDQESLTGAQIKAQAGVQAELPASWKKRATSPTHRFRTAKL